MSPRIIVVYCGLLMTLSAASVDIILPAFSEIAATFPADYEDVQLTITLFLIAIGFGQLISGSLSDRFGRKPVILGGLSIYLIGTVVCYLAPNIELLLTGRIIQGLGVSAAPVVARAMLRDMFSGDELARNIALATAVFAAGPIIAPLVGAVILVLSDWSSIFIWMMTLVLVLISVCVFWLPETNHATDASAMKPSVFAKNTSIILANPTSRFFVVLSGIIYALMIIILSSLPRVFNDTFQINGPEFALLFALHGLGIIAGQFVNRRMITKHGSLQTIRYGNMILIFSCLLLTIGSLSGHLGPYSTIAIITLFATSFLVVFANVTSIVLSQHGEIAGFASSFFGFYSQVSGSILAIAMQFIVQGNMTRFAISLLTFSLVIFVALSFKPKASSKP